jgi:hypothetical protein
VPNAGAGWWGSFATLLIAVAIGSASIALAAIVLRMPELAWALGRSGPDER